MGDTVTLKLVNQTPEIPAQVTVIDVALKQHGRTLLSGAQSQATFAVPPGDYYLSIDRQGLPSEQRLANVRDNQEVEIGGVAEEGGGAADQLFEHIAGDVGGGDLSNLRGFSEGLGHLKGIGPVTSMRFGLERLDTPNSPPPCDVRIRCESEIGPPVYLQRGKDRIEARTWPSGPYGTGVGPEARSELPLALLSWTLDAGRVLALALPLFNGALRVDLRDGLPAGVLPFDQILEIAPLLDTLAADVPLDPGRVWETSIGHGPDRARTVAAFDDLAEGLLRAKFVDPYAATLAGHFLLRFSNFDKVSTWTRNLADYFPNISDGCVLEGWRRLQGGRNAPWPPWRVADPPPMGPRNAKPNAARPEDPISDAAQRFTQAAARGRSVFYHGISRLLDGLYFCLDRLEEGELRAQVIEDIATASRWQRTCFSLGGLTAFEMQRAELDARTYGIATA